MDQSKSITKGVAAGDDEVETGDGEVREISNGLTTEDEALWNSMFRTPMLSGGFVGKST